MTPQHRKKRSPVVAHPDAFRIVPLHGAARGEALAAAPPKLTYRNGPLLKAVEVFTIFWGKGWKTAPAWQTKMVGHYTVQLEWSNKTRACV